MSVGTEKKSQLSVHPSTYSPSEIIINADFFPGVELGDLLSLTWSGAPVGEKQYVRVDSVQRGKGTRQQISVLKSVADAFGLQPWTEVQVSKADNAVASVEFVEFIFKDHFFSRRDLWRLKKSVFGCSAYIGKVFTWKGMRVRVQDLRSHGQPVGSGILTLGTNFNFRSQSCRLYWLVQISKEMYEFSLGGQLHYEMFVNSFLRKLLDKWCAKQVRHTLTVVFFSRTFYLNELDPTKARFSQECRPIYFSSDRKAFEEVVVNTLDPDKLSLQLKREMMEYPSRVGWCIPTEVFADRGQELPKNIQMANSVSIGVPSYASNGNFLEALNVTLNNLEKHYIERDLTLSGNSIVAISASSGVFEVEPYLAAITKQRMMDCGIGMDMISLSQPPFHVAPLFTYEGQSNTPLSGCCYEVPHWMNLSFANDLEPGNDSKKVGMDEQDCNSYRYFDTTKGVMEAHVSIPCMASSLNETEESNVTIDILSCLPSPLAMLLAPNIPHIEPSRTNSIGSGRMDEACGMLVVLSDQKKGGGSLPEYSFPAEILKGRRPPLPSHQRSDKFSPLLYNDKDSDVIHHKFQDFLRDEDKSRTSTSTFSAGLAQSAPHDQRIIDRYISPQQQPSASFGNYATICRSLGSSLSSNQQVNSPFRPFPDSDDSTGLPHQPCIRNIDDGTLSVESGGGSFHLPGPCLIQTNNMPRRKSSTFADHDANVFLRPRMNKTQLKKSMNHSSSHSRSIRTTSESKNLIERSVSHPPKQDEGRTNMHEISKSRTAPQLMDTLGFSVPKSYGNESDSHHNFRRLDSLHCPTVSSHVCSTSSVNIPRTVSDGSCGIAWNESLESHKRSTAIVSNSGSMELLPLVENTLKQQHHLLRCTKDFDDFDDVEVGRLINPFCKRDEEKLLKLRTHNRRRWSHVFPVGEVEFKNIPGPNWKSLCEPSILPLTTDYLPMFERENYLHSNYSLTVGKEVPFGSGNQYSNEQSLMEEMVCQRLAQGFQLVKGNVTTGVSMQDEDGVHGSSWRGRRRLNMIKQQQMIAGPAVDGSGSILYILSMGHRIHCLSYDSISKQIVVKRYLSRYGSNTTSGNKVSYRYSIWSELENTFRTVEQEFYKYPVSEYAWNHLDEMMGGWYSEEMTEPMKYMRNSFVIIPPVDVDSLEGEREYVEKMQKLREYINLRSSVNPGPFNFHLHYSKDPEDNLPYSSHSEEDGDNRQIVHIVLSQQSDQEGGEDNSSCEWLSLVCDKFIDVKRVVYMELRWLVCVSSSVEEHIQHSLYRRAKSLGLELVRVPYLFVTSSLNLSPFITHTHLKLPNATIRDAVIEKLVNGSASSEEGSSGRGLALNFIRGSDLQCDWSGTGLGEERPENENPSKGGLAESLSGGGMGSSFRGLKSHKSTHSSQLKRSASYYHRSALALIRVAPQGFVFQYNYLWPDMKPDEGMSKVRQLLADIRDLISSMSPHF